MVFTGEDEFQKVRASYLRGTSGILFVVDGTRRETLDKALQLHEEARLAIGPVPSVFALSKCDLATAWEIDDAALAPLRERDCTWIATSAKTGQGVDEAFCMLTRRMVAHD
ncbi:MAG: hypothetical protein QM736_15075 [Vicinamibacterales bacterium]